MKMDLAKMLGCLAVSILPLLLLVDPTSACYCLDGPPITLQTAYCASDDVLQGSFTNARFPDGDRTFAIYDFKVTQVFKGCIKKKEQISLHSQILGTTCGYRHNDPFSDNQYIVTGSRLNGAEDFVTISACSFIKPKAQITEEEEAGLNGGYRSGCN